MEKKNTRVNFDNQVFYIGLDIHKKNWTVSIRSSDLLLKTFCIDPEPKILSSYMQNHYPKGKYKSVYEAGYSGYWIHRELQELGIENIIASPTDIPTSWKEKEQKKDTIDSRKLARQLEYGTLEGIFVLSKLNQELRSFIRMRTQIVRAQTRLKNQIKSYLDFYGHKLPSDYKMRHWSNRFITYLRSISFQYPLGKKQLEIYLEELLLKREQLLKIKKEVKLFLDEYQLTDTIELLQSVPGIGFLTAVTILSEIEDINRFSNFDKLASYVGLVPSIRSSSEKEVNHGIKRNSNSYLRQLLVESAWMAVRKDPALTKAYASYQKRMSKQEAIIRIAKKLLSRICYVWKNKTEYKYSIEN